MTFYIWKWNLIRDVLFPYYCSVACSMCYFSFPKAQLYVGILYSTCGRSRETRRPLKVKKNQGRLRAMVDSLAGSPQRKKKNTHCVFNMPA